LTARQRRALNRAFDEVAALACDGRAERQWFVRWIRRIAGGPHGVERAMAVLEALGGGHLDGTEPGAAADRLLHAAGHGAAVDEALPTIRRAILDGARVRLDFDDAEGRIRLDLADESVSIVLGPGGTWHYIGQGARRADRGSRDDLREGRSDGPLEGGQAWAERTDAVPFAR